MGDKHPFPGEWNWWAGSSHEYYDCGPYETREEAIEEGKQSHDYSFVIAECQDNNQDLSRWFDASQWLQDVGEEMDDSDFNGSNEDGECHPLKEITNEQAADLQETVSDAIRAWQTKHGLRLRSYWFVNTRNYEDVIVEPDK